MNIRHIFIVGAKSVGQYGGYETFVDRLIEQHKNFHNIKYHIACKANGDGFMDEKKLLGINTLLVSKNNEVVEFEYNNAHIFKVKVPNLGPAVAIYYDLKALNFCIDFCKKNKIKKPYIYILACRIGPFIGFYGKLIHRLGGKVFVNPDGHEWKRSKWSPIVRRYWKYSEKLMIKAADCVVCDSRRIEKYIRREYERYNPQTEYISYGADLSKSKLDDNDDLFVSWLKDNGIQQGNYYLTVGRFVPENNYETIIREYMKSKTEKVLVIVSNNNPKLFNELEKKLKFAKDERIRFAGAVYDKELLKKIRENAFAYIHGHEVGGTNPSLLEALASTDLNLLFNVGFNREVGSNAAFYWNKSDGNLSKLLNQLDDLKKERIKTIGLKAKERIKKKYSWKLISNYYKSLWLR